MRSQERSPEPTRGNDVDAEFGQQRNSGFIEGVAWSNPNAGFYSFAREGIKTRVWIAPGNAFDETTVSLLPKFGIDIVSAGWFWGPFLGPHQTIWMPCQLSILRSVPSGVWTAYY